MKYEDRRRALKKALVIERYSDLTGDELAHFGSRFDKLYALEPFIAFHKSDGKYPGFPKNMPPLFKRAVNEGRITLITAESIDARTIYQLCMDRAVDAVERVWPSYFKFNKRMIQAVRDILQTDASDAGFKKNLCEMLARFYSAHEVYNRVVCKLHGMDVSIHPDIDPHLYYFADNLLKDDTPDRPPGGKIQFARKGERKWKRHRLQSSLKLYAKVALQAILSTVMALIPSAANKGMKTYRYGFTYLSRRQLRKNRRRIDFLVDGVLIQPEDVVYFPINPLSPGDREKLNRLSGDVVELPRVGRFFGDPKAWWRLFIKSIIIGEPICRQDLRVASSLVYQYLSWKSVLKKIELKYLVTHCDFGYASIGRNIALNEHGIETWYFSDSMNFANNMLGYIGRCMMRHPFWTYLNYDHFVTWHDALSDYFKAHTGSFRKTHVVGCLWAEHAGTTGKKIAANRNATGQGRRDEFIIAVFDTTYSRNITINYKEGIEFASHIRMLADRIPNLLIAFKEKKDREVHGEFDDELGPRLTALYDAMSERDNINFLSNDEDSSELIAKADMTISFPFTSTTFEALSLNKPALWHDPMGFYRKNLYAQIRGVVTHGFDELVETVTELKEGRYHKSGDANIIPATSPLMDPYRDGMAIHRFRKLLNASYGR